MKLLKVDQVKEDEIGRERSMNDEKRMHVGF
jgi:hypothetical protein